MAGPFLNIADIRSFIQQMGGETMAQGGIRCDAEMFEAFFVIFAFSYLNGYFS